MEVNTTGTGSQRGGGDDFDEMDGLVGMDEEDEMAAWGSEQ
jgi:hypothetical protein